MIITIGRKKFAGSMIDTLKETNCGGLNIKETRLGDFKNTSPSGINRWNQNYVNDGATRQVLPLSISDSVGRWPANVLLE